MREGNGNVGVGAQVPQVPPDNALCGEAAGTPCLGITTCTLVFASDAFFSTTSAALMHGHRQALIWQVHNSLVRFACRRSTQRSPL